MTFLSVMELNVGIIVSCLPTLPSIFRGNPASRIKSYHPTRHSFIRQEDSNSNDSSGNFKELGPLYSVGGPKSKFIESSDSAMSV